MVDHDIIHLKFLFYIWTIDVDLLKESANWEEIENHCGELTILTVNF